MRGTLTRALPGLRLVRDYPRPWLRPDVFTGAAVAAYLIPQVLAYSGLVGVPAVVGLWGAVAAMAVYWVFGTSRVLSVGPESTVALMAGTVVGPLAGGDPERALTLSAGLSLVVAGWLALAWLLRLGVIADLLSHPLLVGYLSGGAVLMVVGQLGADLRDRRDRVLDRRPGALVRVPAGHRRRQPHHVRGRPQ